MLIPLYSMCTPTGLAGLSMTDQGPCPPYSVPPFTLMSRRPLTGLACSLSLPIRNSQVLSIPFLTDMGLAPAVTYCSKGIRPDQRSAKEGASRRCDGDQHVGHIAPAWVPPACAPAGRSGSSREQAQTLSWCRRRQSRWCGQQPVIKTSPKVTARSALSPSSLQDKAVRHHDGSAAVESCIICCPLPHPKGPP